MHLEELEEVLQLQIGLGQSHSYLEYNAKRSDMRIIFEMLRNAVFFKTTRSQDLLNNMEIAPQWNIVKAQAI